MKRQKRYFLTIILTAFLWATLFLIIFFIEPIILRDIVIPGIYLPFLINLFLALFFTLSMIFVNTRRGLLITFGLVFFLFLRILGLGNLLNLFLISASIFALELYFSKGNPSCHPEQSEGSSEKGA